ncbi:unnamed protein product [Paramecium octaurelia]|uniref:Uncharacterized protein n=1 Tax=Paramecium octaurelia TaxID=43137 RepID=A0A8S1VTA6_PAROT|nr:unnamed protein product [Paramecium octaurelia]
MLEFQELVDQCSEPKIPSIKDTIIDTNVLFLRLFQDLRSVSMNSFNNSTFTNSQLKEILLEDHQHIQSNLININEKYNLKFELEEIKIQLEQHQTKQTIELQQFDFIRGTRKLLYVQ